MSQVYCLVAAALLGGILMVTFASNKNVMHAYESQLTPEQKAVNRILGLYRLKLWIVGMFLGVAVALFVTRPFSAGMQRGCAFAAVALVVNYLYYMLMPKPAHMIQYLQPEQVDEWLAVKTMMQRNYHLGMLAGAGALLLFGYFA